MKYIIHEIDENNVQVRDETDVPIVECGSKSQAQLVADALSLRDRMLLQLAHSFIQVIDNGDTSAKMAQQWRGTILGNALTRDDANELWMLIRQILDSTKGPGE